MRRLAELAVLALVASACAGRVRPVGPDPAVVLAARAVPAGGEADTLDAMVRAEAEREPARPELEPIPLPEGVSADDFDISLQYNRRVEYWLQYFQRYHETFASWLQRMARYEPYIRRQLTGAGLPGDLIYLALIESGFATSATSSARAVGIWQFMAETARMEGMEVSTYIDERRDPIRATDAAVHHLRSLYRELGSWYLVAAAYNSGSGRVGRALDAQAEGARGADSLFWRIEPVLPGETRDYVPKFLAASMLAKYPGAFGLAVGELPEPDDFDTVHIRQATDLAAIARAARTGEDAIRRLNPQFYRGVTPPGRTVTVRVPAGHAERLLARLSEMPRRERVHDLQHTVQEGETPQSLAARYGVSLAALRKANHLKRKTRLLAEGRELRIPLAPGTTVAERAPAGEEKTPAARKGAAKDVAPAEKRAETRKSADKDVASVEKKAEARRSADKDVASVEKKAETRKSADKDVASREPGRSPPTGRYRVREGDTLGEIAERHGLTLAQLRELNGLRAGSVIRPGQELVLTRPRLASVYRVRQGDTLSGIAREHGVSVTRLRELNALSQDDVLHPGDRVALPVPR